MKKTFSIVLTLIEVLITLIIVISTFMMCWYWYVLFISIGALLIINEVIDPDIEEDDDDRGDKEED